MRHRFAPSPTGYLHLGHGFSALTAWDMAQNAGAEFLLRIEDIDQTRCRPEFEAAICEDLHWLGLRWQNPVLRQSTRLPAYRDALESLAALNLIYPCNCTRRDITEALSARQEGAPTAPVYPGTCRARPMETRTQNDTIRLDMTRALEQAQALGNPGFLETGSGSKIWHDLNPETLLRTEGDVVLARRDIGTSYHLAVVVDDAFEAITHVTRGLDMLAQTPVHVVLQALLGLPTPIYHHHRLIRDRTGKRLAKRDDARALRKYRAEGVTPADIRAMVGL
jgi:glutamyl-Q tRNA(Asp) synthetase